MRGGWFKRVTIALSLTMVFALAGCVEQTSQVAPAGPEAQAGGQVKGSRYLNPTLGLYWYNPGGYIPLAPQGGQDFVFGWQSKDGARRAMMWLISAGAEPMAAAQGLAQAKGWSLKNPRKISWQGLRAADGTISAGKLSGRLRVIDGGDKLLAVAAFTGKKESKAGAAALAALVEGLRLIPPGDVLHTVKSGAETLDLVSLWYTGSAGRWRHLQKYNKLSSSKLRRGQEILVPASLVWRLDPMPGWAVGLVKKPAKGKGKGKKAPAKAPADEDAAPDLELLPTGPK